MADFDMTELRQAVKDLHHQLTDGPTEALSMVLAKLDELAGRQKKRDVGVHKALMMVSTQLKTVLEQQHAGLLGTQVALKALQEQDARSVAQPPELPIGLIRTMSTDVALRTSLAKAQADTAQRDAGKVLLLKKAITAAFGPRGGHAVRYHAETAARMRLSGQITEDEQRRWKLLGRLPDHVRLAS